jgi:nicotinamidase-related amidase/chorismate mutase
MEQATTALLIVDVQRAIDHPSWGRRNNPGAETNMRRMLEHWREQQWPIVHVRHESHEPNSTYRPGQSGCEFKAEVLPLPGETVVTKHTNSAFIGTSLQALLRAHDVGALVICGVITNNSVEATARMAGNLGYLTYVVCDATATFDKLDHDGVLRDAEQIHAMSLANLNGEYAHVVSTVDVINGLPETPAPAACASLAEVLANIDRIDRDLVALLAERGRYVRESAHFKKSEADVRASDRIAQVIAKVKATAEQFGADPVVTEVVYRAMINAFIEAEMKERRHH